MEGRSSSTVGYLWEWNDINDSVYQWKPYSLDLQQKLEQALASKQSAQFEVESAKYVVHVDSSPMVQLNTKTKYKRNVRRKQGTFS